MCAPLYDDKGAVKYFIGAQIDISGLVEDGKGIESFARFLQKEREVKQKTKGDQHNSYIPQHKNSYLERKSKETLDTLQELSAMLSQDEADIVNRSSRNNSNNNNNSGANGGNAEEMETAFSDTGSIKSMSVVPTQARKRGLSKRVIGSLHNGDRLNDTSLSQYNFGPSNTGSGSLPGVYKHYLLVRPYPSLQIIFVSPALRLPGLLRTHLFSKLGGSQQTMSELESAFHDGASVTAKVLWLPKHAHPGERAREVKARWIRCTPLLGSDDRVGVWMIILVPIEHEVSPMNGYGYGYSYEHQHGLVDETEADRMKFYRNGSQSRSRIYTPRTSSRAESVRMKTSANASVDADVYGNWNADRESESGSVFGLRMSQVQEKTIVSARNESAKIEIEDEGDVEDDELYAAYLRDSNSNSTPDIREGARVGRGRNIRVANSMEAFGMHVEA
jgi:hypothetical protein